MISAWWIDEPRLKGCGNPNDDDLAQLRSEGFSVGISLLDESRQPPRYDKQSAVAAGWTIYTIPITEGFSPSLEQIREFTAPFQCLPSETKVVVFCESGLGRTAFMGAAYWIAKGLTASAAVAQIGAACGATDWLTIERRQSLQQYERVRRMDK